MSNVLRVPSITQKLIYVSKFCHSNQSSIEFFPSHFVVKDLHAGTFLLHGKNRQDLYEWPTTKGTPTSSVVALSTSVTGSAPSVIWHGHLCHPSSKIMKSLIQSGLVSLSSSMPLNFICESCLCNKGQLLLFGDSTLESKGPLDLV